MRRVAADEEDNSQYSRRFQGDTRAVTPLIGFILLFGIAVVAFAGYQATTVPEQNAQTEFTHSQEVRDDLVDVRSGILQAGDGDRQVKSVTLGTQYRDRIIAVNPSPAHGMLETSQVQEIDLSEGGSIPTRFLTYGPQYNQLPDDPTVYDTSTLYLDPRERGTSPILYEEQELVDQQGEEIFLVALQNEYRQQGIDRTRIPFEPGQDTAYNVTDHIVNEEDREAFDIKVPTLLPEEKWVDMIGDRLEEFEWQFIEGESVNTLQLQLTTESPPLYLGTVGIDGQPTGPPTSIFSDVIVDPQVTDLDITESAQDQTFSFTVGSDELAEGETVTIELTDEDLLTDISYFGSDATTDEGIEGFAEIDSAEEDRVEITFTAGTEFEEGDTISITVDSVDATGVEEASPEIEYPVNFIDPVGGTVPASFGVYDRAELSNLDIDGQGNSATVLPDDPFDVSVDIDGNVESGDSVSLQIISQEESNTEDRADVPPIGVEEPGTVTFEDISIEETGAYDVIVQADDEDDEPLDEIEGELFVRDIAIQYSEPPTRENRQNVRFEIENIGGASADITSFRVEGGLERSDQFSGYSITTPAGGVIQGSAGYSVGETVSHDPYTIGTNEVASYSLTGFNPPGNSRVRGEFNLVLITEDGTEIELEGVEL